MPEIVAVFHQDFHNKKVYVEGIHYIYIVNTFNIDSFFDGNPGGTLQRFQAYI